MENNTVDEKDGKWLHDVALNNTIIETLNFYQTNIYSNITDICKVGINIQDT
jgi:hypothetical protein